MDTHISGPTERASEGIARSQRELAPDHARANFVIHAAFATTGIVTVLLGPILPILISRWSLTDERAGLFFTTQFCGQLAGCLSTGLLIPLRRKGYRLTFAIGFAFIALGVAALAVGNVHTGLVGTALYGYGLGLGLTGGNLWVAEVFPERRATAVSILNVTWTIGAIACGPLVMLAERTHMLAKFLVGVAVVMAICALLIVSWNIEPRENLPDAPAGERDAASPATPRSLASPAAFTLSVLFFLYVGTESAVGGWAAAYANRVESISAMMSALTPAFFWAGLMIGRALAPAFLRGLAAKIHPEKFLMACGLVLATLATSALLYAGHLSPSARLRDDRGPRPCVRLSDPGGMARGNFRSARPAIRQRHLFHRQPWWRYTSVDGRRCVHSHRSASRGIARADRGDRHDGRRQRSRATFPTRAESNHSGGQ